MPEFLKTDRLGKGGHYHIVYMKTDADGITSVDSGHSHEVSLIAPLGEGFPENKVTLPAEDGHTHEIIPYEVKTKKKKERSNKIVDDVVSLYKHAKEIEADSRKSGKESEEFYRGEQWDKSILGDLEQQKRAALTFNHVQTNVKLLSGYQRQNRTDIKYFPVEDGDSVVADILNIVVKNILENNRFNYEETRSFDDVLIAGRGFWEIREDRNQNIHGDIVIEHFQWDDVYLGPHNKADLSDCEYLVKSKWFSKAKLEQEYPEKAPGLNVEYDIYMNREEDKTQLEEPGKNYVKSDNIYYPGMTPDHDLIDIAKKLYRVMELWRKEFKIVYVLTNMEDDFYFNAEDWPKKDVESVKTIPGFFAVPQNVHRIRKTTVASKTLLDDEYPDMAVNDFTIIPIYADKRGNDFWGKIESAKDPQREINKRNSQMVDILNKVAAYGWFYDSDTFPTSQEKKKFETNSAKPGFTQEVTSVDRIPVKTEGVKFPTELAGYSELMQNNLREIMNINPELLGISSRAESGVAIVEKKRQGLIGNEYVFDNLTYAKQILGKRLVIMIQELYTPERMMRIVENRARRENVQVAGQQLPLDNEDEMNQMRAAIMTLLEDADLTKYDVVVGESAYNPTTRHANFVIWAEMAGKGIPVPEDLLVDLSDLPEKDKVKKAIQERMQAAAAAEEKKNKVELLKAGLDPAILDQQ